MAVAQAVQPRSRVDTNDPQTAHVTGSCAAVTVRIPQALEHRLVGTAEQAPGCTPLAFGKRQHLLVAAAAGKPRFSSRHGMLLPAAKTRSVAQGLIDVRKIPGALRRAGSGDTGTDTEPAS